MFDAIERLPRLVLHLALEAHRVPRERYRTHRACVLADMPQRPVDPGLAQLLTSPRVPTGQLQYARHGRAPNLHRRVHETRPQRTQDLSVPQDVRLVIGCAVRQVAEDPRSLTRTQWLVS